MESYQDLDLFNNKGFSRGRPFLFELLWRVVSFCIFEPRLVHHYGLKRFLLRCFGAHVGENVLIKPRVVITFPWKLHIGKSSWIGEGVWIDNLESISIGDHCIVSQGVYLCTGNHNFKSVGFELCANPIVIEKKVWIGAKSIVGPGVKVSEGALAALGTVIVQDVSENTIVYGNPAQVKGLRIKVHSEELKQ